MAKKITLLMFAVAICWSTLGCGPKSNTPSSAPDDAAKADVDAKVKAAKAELEKRK